MGRRNKHHYKKVEKEVYDLGKKHKGNPKELVRALNKLIIEEEISDKPIAFPDSPGHLAAWGMGCEKTWLGDRDNPDYDGIPTDQEVRPARLEAAQAVLKVMQEAGIQNIFLQGAPGENEQIVQAKKHIAEKSSPVRLALAGDLEIVSRANYPAYLQQLQKKYGITDTEFQVAKDASGHIYINVHLDSHPPGSPARADRIAFIEGIKLQAEIAAAQKTTRVELWGEPNLTVQELQLAAPAPFALKKDEKSAVNIVIRAGGGFAYTFSEVGVKTEFDSETLKPLPPAMVAKAIANPSVTPGVLFSEEYTRIKEMAELVALQSKVEMTDSDLEKEAQKRLKDFVEEYKRNFGMDLPADKKQEELESLRAGVKNDLVINKKRFAELKDKYYVAPASVAPTAAQPASHLAPLMPLIDPTYVPPIPAAAPVAPVPAKPPTPVPSHLAPLKAFIASTSAIPKPPNDPDLKKEISKFPESRKLIKNDWKELNKFLLAQVDKSPWHVMAAKEVMAGQPLKKVVAKYQISEAGVADLKTLQRRWFRLNEAIEQKKARQEAKRGAHKKDKKGEMYKMAELKDVTDGIDILRRYAPDENVYAHEFRIRAHNLTEAQQRDPRFKEGIEREQARLKEIEKIENIALRHIAKVNYSIKDAGQVNGILNPVGEKGVRHPITKDKEQALAHLQRELKLESPLRTVDLNLIWSAKQDEYMQRIDPLMRAATPNLNQHLGAMLKAARENLAAAQKRLDGDMHRGKAIILLDFHVSIEKIDHTLKQLALLDKGHLHDALKGKKSTDHTPSKKLRRNLESEHKKLHIELRKLFRTNPQLLNNPVTNLKGAFQKIQEDAKKNKDVVMDRAAQAHIEALDAAKQKFEAALADSKKSPKSKEARLAFEAAASSLIAVIRDSNSRAISMQAKLAAPSPAVAAPASPKAATAVAKPTRLITQTERDELVAMCKEIEKNIGEVKVLRDQLKKLGAVEKDSERVSRAIGFETDLKRLEKLFADENSAITSDEYKMYKEHLVKNKNSVIEVTEDLVAGLEAVPIQKRAALAATLAEPAQPVSTPKTTVDTKREELKALYQKRIARLDQFRDDSKKLRGKGGVLADYDKKSLELMDKYLQANDEYYKAHTDFTEVVYHDLFNASDKLTDKRHQEIKQFLDEWEKAEAKVMAELKVQNPDAPSTPAPPPPPPPEPSASTAKPGAPEVKKPVNPLDELLSDIEVADLDFGSPSVPPPPPPPPPPPMAAKPTTPPTPPPPPPAAVKPAQPVKSPPAISSPPPSPSRQDMFDEMRNVLAKKQSGAVVKPDRKPDVKPSSGLAGRAAAEAAKNAEQREARAREVAEAKAKLTPEAMKVKEEGLLAARQVQRAKELEDALIKVEKGARGRGESSTRIEELKKETTKKLKEKWDKIDNPKKADNFEQDWTEQETASPSVSEASSDLASKPAREETPKPSGWELTKEQAAKSKELLEQLRKLKAAQGSSSVDKRKEEEKLEKDEWETPPPSRPTRRGPGS